MKLLIAGSRSIREFDFEGYVPDETALIVWDGKSMGTKHTIEYAKRLNKPVISITRTDEE